MKILISGNIASGKGTLIKKVLELLPDYEHLAIDDYREKYGDETEVGEDRAREQFIFDLRWSENCLIECTGVGRLYTLIKPEIDFNFLLLTSANECEKRFRARNTKTVLPKTWFQKSTFKESLDYIAGCHSRTKYKLMVRNNGHRDAVKVATKIKGLQKRNKSLH